eukprot:CCRYP_010372-RA/>CCRYP_010372-RA protein AED:0.22 eAED:-0.16 QI:0/0/0/1/1/1/2/0/429
MQGPPEGVPLPLAISIAAGGYTEAEARLMLIEGGDGGKADEWIQKLKAVGCFGSTTSEIESCRTRGIKELVDTGNDPGLFLWKKIRRALDDSENGFKHQLVVLDNCIKNNGGLMDSDLSSLSRKSAEQLMPFWAIADHFPWNGCKFAASCVMHLISEPTPEAKRNACRTVARSLGGCRLEQDLAATRWPQSLVDSYEKAVSTMAIHSTALFVTVSDVEIMRHPEKDRSGVYFYQAYGPRGYTLLQYLKAHEDEFPLSLEKGRAWVKEFQMFAGDLVGIWTERINKAYKACFDVDLVELGCMKIGSQMDMHVKVEEDHFDTRTVQKNFDILPKQNDSFYPPCQDDAVALGKKTPRKHTTPPDGGVPHYYVPLVLRCSMCGKHPPKNGSGQHKQCSRCKKVFYCSKECQASDWKLRHHQACKQLQSILKCK